MNKAPRLLIAGTSSGSGKTTITMGILKQLKNLQLNTAAFKCGPDYIDPMFHKEVLKTPSNNLDAFMLSDDSILSIFNENKGQDISIIEGVMGYYDGINARSYDASSYHLAKILKAPTILVVNCKGISSSILAIIKGFITLKEDNLIKGVILNNISEKVYNDIKKQINEIFPKLHVLGYVPKLPKDCLIESRHLGLVTAKEIDNLNDKINQIVDIIKKTIDFNLLMEIANSAPLLENNILEFNKVGNVKIGVAYDEAFCFYYDANLKLLEKLGAELIYFSPIHDDLIPDIDGLYIGGGYPELYLDQLSKNKKMLNTIKELINNKLPCLAECGGFMYLGHHIDGYEMVNYLDNDANNQNKLVRFGYVTLIANNNNLILNKDEEIKGHEFHYYDTNNNGTSFELIKTNGIKYEAVISNESLYAGFPHLHFYSNPKAAINFVKKCLEYRSKL